MDPTWYICLYGIFSSIVILAGCYMNTTVLLFFASKRYLRTPTNLLLVNLSVSNMLALFFVLPFNIVNIKRTFEYRGALCDTIGLFFHIWWLSNVFTLMFLSYDHLKYISCPLLYSTMMTHTKTYVFIGVTWCLAIAFSVVPIFSRPQYTFQHDNTCRIDWQDSVIFNMVFACFGFGLPCLVMLYCHTCIILDARTMRRTAPMPSKDRQRRSTEIRRLPTYRVMKKSFVILATFLIAWLPQVTLIFLASFKRDTAPMCLSKITHALIYLPVVIYPYVLVFRDVILGRELKRFKNNFYHRNVRVIQPSSHIDINDYSDNYSRRNSRSEVSDSEGGSRKNSLSASLREWRSSKQNSCISIGSSRRESHESTLTNVYL